MARAVAADSTTGLTTRTASVLSYLGWWVTGLLFWAIERRDPLVRFHAAQSTVTFGGLAVAIVLLGGLGLVMLSFAPRGFLALVGTAAALWLLSLFLWVAALWQAGRGKRWRIPLAARYADALLTRSAARASSSSAS
jgi:uncharacterized membrane protein